MPVMAMEELAECIQAISKIDRKGAVYHDDKEHLIKEMADCYISLFAIAQRYDITADAVTDAMNEKLNKSVLPAGRSRLFIDINRFCCKHPEITVSSTSLTNQLLRNDIDTVDRLIMIMHNPDGTFNNKWYSKLRHIGKSKADIYEKFASEYSQ